ncbi:uncharacterized protein LOC127804952 [Diospyros lotus]|uniref:uncharacterized protein LOC127804952 n=1 Tax=Diospyros lotus TaxID=55363 RepID=UPI0022570F5A|nr:uncharacterized protein LOC127804952 [Diospyros lotus]
MESSSSTRYSRSSQPQSLAAIQRKSGYEPSDTETEQHESRWRDFNRRNGDIGLEGFNLNPDQGRTISPLRLSRRHSARFFDGETSSPTEPLRSSPPRRRHSKSPYKPRRDDGNVRSPSPVSGFPGNGNPLSPELASDSRRNVSPFSKLEGRRHISPYKPAGDELNWGQNDSISSNAKQNRMQDDKNVSIRERKVNEVSRASGKSNYSHRSLSAPRPRSRENDQQIRSGHTQQNGYRTPSPLPGSMSLKDRKASHRNTPSVGELNEMVADAKISRVPLTGGPDFESTDSISQGDIFFSRDYANLTMTMQKIVFPKKDFAESRFNSKPQKFTGRDPTSHQQNKTNGNFGHSYQRNSSSTVLTQTISSSAASRQTSDKISSSSGRFSAISGRSSASFGKFVTNRKKSQSEAWFSCLKKGSCRTLKSPEKTKEFDEASMIEKAFVVEGLRQFWADKHQPASLNGFTCHRQEAQVLKQLVSEGVCPHILLGGPSGSGKKSLIKALLREIFGEPASDISHDLGHFHIQETRPVEVAVSVTSSSHHVELNVYLEPNARYALMALVKQISSSYAITTEISSANPEADYKVMVLYEVDKAAENIQHLIKWIMDCYTDSCKLILCCEDDLNILEPVRNCCKIIKVDPPVTHEIMEVLGQIARKEDFDLPTSFAAKIASKSKHNLRKAIMALEACKAHNYPFVEEQPIPLGWEEVLEELAAEILADPSHKRFFAVRGRIQKLLMDFVHPKLILQKLVEQFLKGVEASSKRELYFWHGYYDKRLPAGTSALLKLEEFVAKFMGIHRKNISNLQNHS